MADLAEDADDEIGHEFRHWLAVLEEDVIQDEYGYEPGEFCVFPELWRDFFDQGLSPLDAWKRALSAREAAREAASREVAERHARIVAGDEAAILRHQNTAIRRVNDELATALTRLHAALDTDEDELLNALDAWFAGHRVKGGKAGWQLAYEAAATIRRLIAEIEAEKASCNHAIMRWTKCREERDRLVEALRRPIRILRASAISPMLPSSVVNIQLDEIETILGDTPDAD